MEKIAGRENWFRDVFNSNYENILNYLYYLSGDMELSEDLAQDVFIKLWDKSDRINHATLKAFLYTLAKNSFLKSLRRKKIDMRFRSGYLDKVELESPEYLMELREFDHTLQQTIASLPEKCRVVYLMSRIDGMSNAQIAENLGVTVKAVEKQMTRAISNLRNKFGIKL